MLCRKSAVGFNMRSYVRIVLVIATCLSCSFFVFRWISNGRAVNQVKTRDILSDGFKPGNSTSRVVFYNRVGKCGSRSVLYLTNRLSKLHRYTFLQSKDFSNDHPPNDEAIAEIEKISKLKPPIFYNRHIHYLDFKKYGHPQPIYINVVRDPIDRFSSQYNYIKYGDGEGKVPDAKPEWPDINECVMKQTGVCDTNFMFYIGMYFCGFDKVCETPSQVRVELAKQHIDEEYAFIGLLEEFDNTLLLLQKMLPEYFLGAAANFKEHSRSKKKTSTKIMDVLTEESKEKLRNVLMKDEYEVYYHARKKFEALKRKYGIFR